jgi:hypothetical protein
MDQKLTDVLLRIIKELHNLTHEEHIRIIQTLARYFEVQL